MERDFKSLGSTDFDVLVIGAGIFGSAVAWDCALRGMKTALIDKGDFGAATSAGCFKIVHGGLRYLQHLDLKRLKESVDEQRTLRRIAPHLLEPLPFLIPCYRKLMQRREILDLGCSVYEILALYRNWDVEPELHLPRHKLLSTEQVLQIAPGLSPAGLKGGVVYFDCQMISPERLTLAVVQSAEASGATVCNYAAARRCDLEPAGSSGAHKISAVEVSDVLTGVSAVVRARMVVNATGPWSELFPELMAGAPPVKRRKVYSKGFQIVVPELIARYALAVQSEHADPAAKVSRGSRSYFIQPWGGVSLVGTTDELWEGSPDEFTFNRAELLKFLGEVRRSYNSPLLTEDRVLYAFGGLQRLAPEFAVPDDLTESYGAAKVARKEIIADGAAAAQPIANLVSVQGVKYTTFRKVAEQATDLIVKKLQLRTRCRTDDQILANAPADSERSQTDRRLNYLTRLYGNSAQRIIEIESGNPALARSLIAAGADSTFASEIAFAAREECAVSLQDAVLRRTALGTKGHPGAAALQIASRVLGAELNWSDDKVEQEVRDLNRWFLSRSIDLREPDQTASAVG